MKPDESITAILPVRSFGDNRYVVMATKKGVIKKVELMEFARSRKGGIAACSLDDGDALVSVGISFGEDEIILATKNGLAIRFEETKVRGMGRTARGVRGITLEEGDAVIGMTIVAKAGSQVTSEDNRISSEATFLTVCENGHGKRTLISDYRSQNRGGKGVIDIKTDDRNGSVVAVCAVDEKCQLMLITSAGKLIRFNANDISVIGRNTRGVRLIDLEESEKVVALAHIKEVDD